jgi:hypothetical protein
MSWGLKVNSILIINNYMISFKEYYIISENRKDMYSWLSPQAQIVHVVGSGHPSHAISILNRLGINDFENGLDKMFELGWFRITHYDDSLYMHNNKSMPNNKQLNAMKNVAIENHMENIILDNEVEDRIIWSNKDW